MATIPILKTEKTLPLSFRLLSTKPTDGTTERNQFVEVDRYQGLALTKPFHKPISKIIDLSILR